jgi:uncharacterized phage protein (TIGR02218 family)
LKPWTQALKDHYTQTTTSLATFWRVTRRDGQVFGWVDHDQDLVIDGLTYYAAAGLLATATQTTSTLAPGTLDVSTFLTSSDEQAIEAGLWDEAAVLIFEARWDVLPTVVDAQGCNILLAGTLGTLERQTGRVRTSLHGQLEALDVHVGRVFAPTCPWRLGDSRCTVDLGPHTRTGSITALGPSPLFQLFDANQGAPDGFFDEGVITFTSGPNQGHQMDIRHWESTLFYFHRPLPFVCNVGDTYSAVRGDDKRFETCVGTFNNARFFGGFPHLPGIDRVLENPLLKPAVARPEAP